MGRGLATEAGRAGVRYGFEVVGLEQIISVTRADHAVSRRVMEKGGLAFQEQLVHQGGLVVWSSIDRADWQPAQSIGVAGRGLGGWPGEGEVWVAVRAVIFDIGGVLELPTDPELAGRWERRLGLAPGAFFARLRRFGLGGAANLGRISETEFGQRVGGLYGLDEPTTAELLEDLGDWYVGELNTEMTGYFQRLRPRYRTAILSNAAAGGRRQEQARYGFDAMADVLVYSYEVGIEKPDRRIYRLTCERLGVHPSEAAMVDDVEANVLAAREVGMGSVRFLSTAQAISDLEACLTQSTS